MRHNAAGRKLGRKTPHRLAMFRNQLASLVASERIVTTVAKAKELRPLAERIVTQGKRGTVHARRLVGRWVADRALIKKLFDEIAPRFASRPGGYLRIVKLGARQGDGAEMAVLEFVDFQLGGKTAKPKADVEASKGKGKGKGKGRGAGAKAAGEEAEAQPAEAEVKPSTRKKAGAGKKTAAKAKPPAKKPGTKAKPTTKTRPTARPAAAKKTSTPKKIGGS